MAIDFSSFNWLTILASVIAGQVILTVWFVVLFAEPWARAYGATSAKEHTSQIPPWTYGIQIACMALLAIGLASLQQALSIASVGPALGTGLIVAVCFAIATALPGYAFLKKLDGFAIALGSQTVVILVLSVILALWK